MTVVVVNELQEQVLVREEQLSLREEGLTAREATIKASEQVIGAAQMVLDIDRAQVETSRQDYLERLRVHTTTTPMTTGTSWPSWWSFGSIAPKSRQIRPVMGGSWRQL
jgi:hypothetical protein